VKSVCCDREEAEQIQVQIDGGCRVRAVLRILWGRWFYIQFDQKL